MTSFFEWFKGKARIKRWLFIILLGVLFLSYSISKVLVSNVLDFKDILIMIVSGVLGTLVIIYGLIRIQKRSLEIFIEANGVNYKNLKDENINMKSLIFDKTVYDNGPKVVVIGGGSGLDTVISGLKKYTNNITAIATLSDEKDEEYKQLLNEDVKQSISALAINQHLMEELLNWNMTSEKYKNVNFGDAYITAVQEITGTVAAGLNKSQDLLDMIGEVAPVSLDDLMVCAEFNDGLIVEGKHKITNIAEERTDGINRVYISPSNCRPNPRVIEAIKEADLIVVGPGRLYTNIIPNFLVKNIANTIRESKAPKVYIANIMTEKGETNGYTLSDHIRAIFEHSGGAVFNFCICDTGEIIPEYIRLYHSKGSEVIDVDHDRLKSLGIKVMKRDMSRVVNEKIRHDSDTIALALMEIIFSEIKYTEQRDEVKYGLLNKVLREQQKIQKKIERNLKRSRRKSRKEEKEKEKELGKGKEKDKSKIKDSKKDDKAEEVDRVTIKSKQQENLDRIQIDEDLKDREPSKFLEKYKDRLESVRNADLIREENIKKMQADEEQRKVEKEQRQAQDEIKTEAEELFKQIKKLEKKREDYRKKETKDSDKKDK